MNAIKLETNAYSLFYGKFHALEDISLKISGKQVTAIIGPLAAARALFCALSNRMNDLIPGVRTEVRRFWTGKIFSPWTSWLTGSGLGWFSKSRTLSQINF
jgi:ABC-type phosphate transport system ATPase subunit